MVVTSLTREEAGEIYNEIRDIYETDFYWYVEALVEIFERHGWRKESKCSSSSLNQCE